MAVSPFLSSINSGEFSPRMEARVDFDRYPNAAKMCRNFVLLPQGGLTRRPGSRFVKEVKDSSAETKMIPFEFSEDDSYGVEAGNNYFRFYRRQGNITVAATDAAVSNGTFPSNITGWTSASTGSATIAHDATNGRMQLTGASGGIAWAYQAITIGASYTAVEHVLRFRITGFGGGTVGFQVGTTSTASDILSEVQLEPGYHSIAFTPGAATFYVQFRNNNTPVRNMSVDDIAFLSDAPMELTSPYTTANLSSLVYFQAADIVYLCNGSNPIQKLERRGHRSWSIVEAFFEDGPYLEIASGADLSSSQLLANSLFENGLSGWTDNSTGNGAMVYNEEGKFAELDPGTSAGTGVAIMRTTATVVSGKKLTIHVLILAASANYKFGTAAGGTQYVSGTQQPGWVSYEITTTSTTLHIQFDANDYDKGRSGIGGCLIYSEDAKLIDPSATTGTITLTALGFSPFKSSDVGRLMRLDWPGQEPGYGVITAYTSTTVVSMLVLRALPSGVPTESWRFGAWGGDQSYPKVITFFDGRLVTANTDGKPGSMWLSQSGVLSSMRPDSFQDGDSTVQDDDAIAVTLRSTKINPIFWASGHRKLLIGTAGGQWIIQSSGASVTPSDISAKQHAAVPCANIKNIEINQTILFADRSLRQVHDLGYSLQEDSFLATDLTILSDHIFRSRLEEMAYQRSPFSIVWGRREDGRLATLSYNKQHQILGWSHSILGGSFEEGDAVVESIITIPGSSDTNQFHRSDERNEVWMIVKRTINGSTKRYIEFLEYYFDGVLREDYDTEVEWRNAMRDLQVDAFYVDCGLTYQGAPTTVISGLDHLEGETVKILADGVVVQDKTVSSGRVSINTAASTIHVGLPYRHRYESLKLASGGAEGTSVNKVKIISAVGLVLLDAYDFDLATVDYDEDGRRQHELLKQTMLRDEMDPDEAVPLFTGEIRPSTEGAWSRDSRIYIESDQPLPCTILGLAPQMEIRAAG